MNCNDIIEGPMCMRASSRVPIITLYHIGRVIDFRINKGNAAQSFMFKNQVYRPMGESTGSTPFLLLLAIMQPILFFTSLKFFGLNGTAFITAILILILILFIIWMWVSGKNPFASNEEE